MDLYLSKACLSSYGHGNFSEPGKGKVLSTNGFMGEIMHLVGSLCVCVCVCVCVSMHVHCVCVCVYVVLYAGLPVL